MNDDATHPLPEPHVGSVLCYYTAEQMLNFAAEQVRALEAENATLKRDLQYARDGLTKGRTRMREDLERLRAENAALNTKNSDAYTEGRADELSAAIAHFEKTARDTDDQSHLGKAFWCRAAAEALRNGWHR